MAKSAYWLGINISYDELEVKKTLNGSDFKDLFKFIANRKDNEITYNLECAVAELILNEGRMDMWLELNSNGDPSEKVAEFLEREVSDGS